MLIQICSTLDYRHDRDRLTNEVVTERGEYMSRYDLICVFILQQTITVNVLRSNPLVCGVCSASAAPRRSAVTKVLVKSVEHLHSSLRLGPLTKSRSRLRLDLHAPGHSENAWSPFRPSLLARAAEKRMLAVLDCPYTRQLSYVFPSC